MRVHFDAESKVNDGGSARSTQTTRYGEASYSNADRRHHTACRMGGMGAIGARAIHDDRRPQRNRAGDRRNMADPVARDRSHAVGRHRRLPVRRDMRHSDRHSAVLLPYCRCRVVPAAVGRADDAVDFNRATVSDLVRFRDFRQNRDRGRVRLVSDRRADGSRA